MPLPSIAAGAVKGIKPFTIIADPWLKGYSTIGHRIFSSSKHLNEPFTNNLAFIEPDIILISQDKSDHCNQETLKTLSSAGGHFIILAEPAAAKKIRGWKYFAEEKVITLPKWEDGGVREISIPGPTPLSTPGKMIIGFISQKWSVKAPAGLHKAIAISYQAPSVVPVPVDTPPQTPPETGSASDPRFVHPALIRQKPISIIFAPHGCDSAAVEKYCYAHFGPIGALPLSAMLHCFDEVTNPPYLGGNICRGLPGGLKLAQSLSPEVWISTHDGEKEVKGLTTGALTITKYDRSAVEQAVSPRKGSFGAMITSYPPPEVVKLGVGEVYLVPKGVEHLFDGEEEEPTTPRIKNRDAKKREGMFFGNTFVAFK